MADNPRRSPVRRLRPVRVPTPGLRARVDEVDGDLVNVSATGALVRTDRELPVGSTEPVILDLVAKRIRLRGRVVRCVPATIDLPGGATLRRQAYAIAVVFLESDAPKAVADLCGGRVALEELQYGILFVGEEMPLNDLIRRTLVDAGYDVHVAHDVTSARTRAQETHPDLVIVDIKQARERSWWGVLEAFAADPAFGELVVLFEPVSLTPDRRRYLAEKDVRFLVLPFTPEELLAAVERALRGSG